ncbi:bifunctional adenosylcobinamide kinase/adenosylcobinamide-phosphate guanylyltransferase [Oscillospiraceae bacterium MB08-C2-2]|nr:bifunctional adenosylcobinamide kinase/adenosylcobinamide-phosphate guanylyltransferase [Oscillospiraceae bacterium MB08-C2-2]
MNILIGGGCKNGKSTLAQHLARELAGEKLYYIATMEPVDGEDHQRIARHRREREGWGFETLEQPRHIEKILERSDPAGTFLLDSITSLLAQEMFLPDGSVSQEAGSLVTKGLTQLAQATGHLVMVSDAIYSDARQYDSLTQLYRRELAGVERAMAALCDCVLEVSAGCVIFHKGREALSGFEAIL